MRVYPPPRHDPAGPHPHLRFQLAHAPLQLIDTRGGLFLRLVHAARRLLRLLELVELLLQPFLPPRGHRERLRSLGLGLGGTQQGRLFGRQRGGGLLCLARGAGETHEQAEEHCTNEGEQHVCHAPRLTRRPHCAAVQGQGARHELRGEGV